MNRALEKKARFGVCLEDMSAFVGNDNRFQRVIEDRPEETIAGEGSGVSGEF